MVGGYQIFLDPAFKYHVKYRFEQPVA